ncbi:aminotransferase class IV [Catellatospora sichuanensis]|uniref:aminotransferase class IV n=1 Tax=Catellatospora sichuanensis TaxID=1969805 RepID=UPI001642660B|nr:aminotransferase class IV [Catellatospora sichuanensis]
MTELDELRVEIDGRAADADALALIEHRAWGHFTAMQVRDGRTRGLDLHLDRLQTANLAVYGTELDGTLIRDRIRHALDGVRDASVRVYGYWGGVIVTVRRPEVMPSRPHAMGSQHFQRPLAGLKHPGSAAAQGYFLDRALATGFDEALLVGTEGTIAEGAITNVGFWRAGSIVWPAAPALPGITMLVLRREFAAQGVAQGRASIRLADLPGYDGMFLCNSRGWAPVNRVDDAPVPVPTAMTAAIARAYDAAPWDAI